MRPRKMIFPPIIDRHQELMIQAYLLKNSEIPVLPLDELGKINKSLVNLEKQTKELDLFISQNKKVTNKLIMNRLNSIHDTFHEIMGLCKE